MSHIYSTIELYPKTSAQRLCNRARDERTLLIKHDPFDGRVEPEQLNELMVGPGHLCGDRGAEDDVGDLRLRLPPLFDGPRCCPRPQARQLVHHDVHPDVQRRSTVGASVHRVFLEELFREDEVPFPYHRLLTCQFHGERAIEVEKRWRFQQRVELAAFMRKFDDGLQMRVNFSLSLVMWSLLVSRK